MVELIIFGGMAGAIIYLLFDNKKMEDQLRITMKALVVETHRRKTVETMAYGKELDLEDVFDLDEVYED